MSIFPLLTQLCVRLVQNDWLETIGEACLLLSVLLLWWALRGKAISVHPLDLKESSCPDSQTSLRTTSITAATSQPLLQSFERARTRLTSSAYAGTYTPQLVLTGSSRDWGSSGGSPDGDYDGYDSAMSSDALGSPTQLFKVLRTISKATVTTVTNTLS